MQNLSSRTEASANARVLIGSTDPAVLRDLAALDPQGYQLIPIQTSHEALHYLEQRCVELIIFDLDSLSLDGLLAARIIRNRSHTRHIPMIMLYSNAQLPLHAIDGCNGCIDYLTKPYDPEVLIWKIVSYLRLRAYLSHIKDYPTLPGEFGSSEPTLDSKQESRDDRMESFIRFNSSVLSNQLAACIAHEIKNPLTTMQAMLEVAKLSQRPLFPDKIEVLLDELQRISTIVNNFMAISKYKRSNRASHHLEKLVQGIKPLLEAKSTLEKKTIIYELNSCPPVVVNCQDIVQLVLNLALNGLEAMAEQGTKLMIGTRYQDGQVILRVADEGPGIPADVTDRIWEPFYTTKPAGSGLGLVICRALAERNDAQISVDSTSSGTVFTVKFPPQAD